MTTSTNTDILNLTVHAASPAQLASGVYDVPEWARSTLLTLLDFKELPTREEVAGRANKLVGLVLDIKGADRAPGQRIMIGGALWLMTPLQLALEKKCFTPVFAFSARESVETVATDGSTTKTSVFVHKGFV